MPFFRRTLCLASALMFSHLALSQNPSKWSDWVAEMVVYAEKRMADVQEVPLSIQVLPGDLLERTSVENISEAAQYVPNLFLSEFSARKTSFPFIRGVGSGLGEPAVVTYIDGVPQLSSSSTNIELLDLARIEVLRGPQGSLYGRNTMGGLIHYISNQPDETFRLRARIDTGSDSRQRFDVASSGELGGNWFGSLAAVSFSRDGFTENRLTGESVDDRDTLAGRLNLVYSPNENLDLRIGYYGERNEDGGFTLFDLASIRENPHELAHDFEGKTERDIRSPSLTLQYRSPSVIFDAVVSQQEWDATDLSDLDFTPLDLLQRNVREDQTQRYAEFRVSSVKPFGNVVGVNWLLGLSWFDSTFDHNSTNAFLPTLTQLPITLTETADYRLDDEGLALFFQVDVSHNDLYNISVGGRYLTEDKQSDLSLESNLIPEPFNRSEATLDDDFEQFLPRVNFSFHPRNHKNEMLYASVAKGYRSGGYNRNTTPTGPFRFNEEKSWTYEIGYKTRLLENRLIINSALFLTDWEDRQLEVADPFLPGRFYLDNVGESESQGIEVDVQAKLTDEWFVLAGYGYTDAEFSRYQDPFTGIDATGKSLPIAPDSTWHLGLHYDSIGENRSGLFAHADLAGVGTRYFDNLNTVSQNSYVRTNLRAGYSFRGYSLEVWGKNVFDEDYVALAIPSNFSTSGYVGRSGDPAQFGVSLGFRY